MVNKTILVVDDSPAHLETLREAVTGVNARIITATNGNEAVQKQNRKTPI